MRPLSEHRKRLAHDLAEPAIRTLLRDLRLRNLGRGSVTVVNDADYAQAFGIAQGLFYAGVNDFAPNDGRDKFFRRIQEAVEAEWIPKEPKDWFGRKIRTSRSIPSNQRFDLMPSGVVGVIRDTLSDQRLFEVAFPSLDSSHRRWIYTVSSDFFDVQVAAKGDYKSEVWVRGAALETMLVTLCESKKTEAASK